MTDEEMAEEWCKENMDCIKTVSFLNHDCNYFSDEARSVAKSAFLTGLKAGRPKWHKVADGDLPESLMSVVNQCGEKVTYNDYCKSWRYDDTDEYFCAKPIAWCEIPKFSEKSD